MWQRPLLNASEENFTKRYGGIKAANAKAESLNTRFGYLG